MRLVSTGPTVAGGYCGPFEAVPRSSPAEDEVAQPLPYVEESNISRDRDLVLGPATTLEGEE